LVAYSDVEKKYQIILFIDTFKNILPFGGTLKKLFLNRLRTTALQDKTDCSLGVNKAFKITLLLQVLSLAIKGRRRSLT
jgi:hypothetical protein